MGGAKHHIPGIRPLGSLLVTAVIAYGVVVGAAYLFQRHLVYFPSSGHGALQPDDFHVPEMRAVTLRTDDGLTLTSWYAAAQAGRPTMVYFHGNGGHLGWRGRKVRNYLDAGMGLLLVSYRGYGGNPGVPSEAGLYADGRAALAFLNQDGVEDANMVLYGESLGTGVAVEMARGREVAALVLEAPPTSIVAVGQSQYWFLPVRLLAREIYDSAAKIGEVRAPILIVHGRRDRIVPIKFGRQLFDLAPEPKEFSEIPDAGHNDLYDHGAAERVQAFLRRNLDF